MSTLDYGQKNRNTPEKLAKAAARKPSTEAQKLAQRENYALFTLLGMKGQLNHLNYEGANAIIEARCADIRLNLDGIEALIKSTQQRRKEKNHG